MAVTGIALGLMTFLLLSSTIAQLSIAAFWKVGLIPGSFEEASRSARAFETPWGMLAAHLALASLIPLSLALVALVHRTRPRWLLSVKPGLRWGYLLGCAGVALVVLNLVLWASAGFTVPPIRPQEGYWGFLAVILITAPFQAAGEEFFFRGYLIQAVGSIARNPWLPILVSALIFAAFHGTQNLPLFLDRFGFGVLAGVLVARTGGLEAAIAIHVVNNILAFSYAGLVSSIAQIMAVQQVGWVDLARDLGSFAVCAVLAWWLGRRLGIATAASQAGSV